MYAYHNDLPSAASGLFAVVGLPVRPQARLVLPGGLRGLTAAAIYDSGNLVIWWFGVVGIVFVSIMAFRRRSPALALVAIGFAAQWVSWARIDRAAFQYHYYTALPFLILALAYLSPSSGTGASRRTWLAVRPGRGRRRRWRRRAVAVLTAVVRARRRRRS